MGSRRVTQVFPALVPLRLWQRRLFKRASEARMGLRYAWERRADDLEHLVKEQDSVLVRALDGVDPRLQHNKVSNLTLAAGHIDGVLVRPGQTFSFWHLVGPATARRGYVEGLVIRDGSPAAGVGGGLCQISNMAHWLALHSDLAVTERHHHSVDLFPDSDRHVPFGTGATLLAGIYDLKLFNPTTATYQIRLRLTGTHLVGQLRTDSEPPVRYEVSERDHRFTREGDQIFRSNRIVRRAVGGPAAGDPTEVTLLANHSPVGYPVAAGLLGP
jgi:vancomycin resistance protein VanW